MKMKRTYRAALSEALFAAAAMIEGHMDTGYTPSENGIESFSDDEYSRATKRAANMIEKLAHKSRRFKVCD